MTHNLIRRTVQHTYVQHVKSRNGSHQHARITDLMCITSVCMRCVQLWVVDCPTQHNLVLHGVCVWIDAVCVVVVCGGACVWGGCRGVWWCVATQQIQVAVCVGNVAQCGWTTILVNIDQRHPHHKSVNADAWAQLWICNCTE